MRRARVWEAGLMLFIAAFQFGGVTAAARAEDPTEAAVAAQITGVLRARVKALQSKDRQGFLRFADPATSWYRFQEIAWASRFEPTGPVVITSLERIGETWRVHARIGREHRIFLFRSLGGRWVTTEPTETELGPVAMRSSGFFRVTYYPRWESQAVVTEVLMSASAVALALLRQFPIRTDPVEIFLHHRAADRQALGWEVITARGASRLREVHLWSPHSYGWGTQSTGAAFQRDLRRTLAYELLFFLPGIPTDPDR